MLGVSGHSRESYRIWAEGGRAPDFVLEVLSRTTHLKDEKDKREAYQEMGVREYFRYDPKGTTMARRTGHRPEGERLADGLWKSLERQGPERILSAVLGLELRVKREEREPDFRELRFRNPRTGKDLRTHSEAEARGTARPREPTASRLGPRQRNERAPSWKPWWRDSGALAAAIRPVAIEGSTSQALSDCHRPRWLDRSACRMAGEASGPGESPMPSRKFNRDRNGQQNAREVPRHDAARIDPAIGTPLLVAKPADYPKPGAHGGQQVGTAAMARLRHAKAG